ncbi:MAG: amidohydrolase [Clostridia bacterium]|nr:amidohydrolase [Clostridia bacterium]
MNEYFGKIIDAHCHFTHKFIPERLNTEGKPNADGKLICEDIDFLIDEHKKMGVKKLAMSSFCSLYYPDKICEENDYLAALKDNKESILQWVVVDPRNKDTFKQAEKLLPTERTLGLKIHSPMHKYDIHSYADYIFGWANERNAVVLMHPDDKTYCGKIADKYQNMKLIIAHLGDLEYIDVIANSVCGNIYTDTSGIASYKNNITEYAVGKIGSEKILFGTDTYSCAFQLGRIYFADISDKDKENILFKNAEKLFGI